MPASETVFRRAAILGTGLIGGSFGLAVRKHFPAMHITGWDREAVLREAEAKGAIGEGTVRLDGALAGADLVYLALPIGMVLELLPEIARRAEPQALVTDASSTKRAVCHAAERCFAGSTRFLGGHPMAGKELGGIEYADAELLRGATYALIGGEEDTGGDPRLAGFARLLERLGARPVWMDAETHDWAVAIISHLPQLVSVAVAELVGDETDERCLPVRLAGSGLRDVLRLAGSPYATWRDIVLTNSDNIGRALDRLSQAIEHLRAHLTDRQLEDEFAAANELYRILREFE